MHGLNHELAFLRESLYLLRICVNFYPCHFPLKNMVKQLCAPSVQSIGCEGFATPLWSVSHFCDQIPEDFRGRFTVAHSFWSFLCHGEEGMAEQFSTHHIDQEADSEAYRKGSRKNNSPKGMLPQTYVTQPSPSSRPTSPSHAHLLDLCHLAKPIR